MTSLHKIQIGCLLCTDCILVEDTRFFISCLYWFTISCQNCEYYQISSFGIFLLWKRINSVPRPVYVFDSFFFFLFVSIYWVKSFSNDFCRFFFMLYWYTTVSGREGEVGYAPSNGFNACACLKSLLFSGYRWFILSYFFWVLFCRK